MTTRRPSSRFEPFDFDQPGDDWRRAHSRRSLRMTLLTLAIGVVAFALFFGLVAACDRL
ncbi:MAG TPA: hypothetical protein VG406_10880 [Isosphaeraceae bacterium]|jgi:hypothetical protein|nr:hypothetical protein [Isosphaeraceae bacterium]